MSVDLGAAQRLAVDHYCLRYGYGNRKHVLWNWRMQGSNDNTTWAVLKTHTNDQALAATVFSTAAWPLRREVMGVHPRELGISLDGGRQAVRQVQELHIVLPAGSVVEHMLVPEQRRRSAPTPNADESHHAKR
jgi:hypothetical protein